MAGIKSYLKKNSVFNDRSLVFLSYLLLLVGLGAEVLTSLGIFSVKGYSEYTEIRFSGLGIYCFLALVALVVANRLYFASANTKLPVGLFFVFFPSVLLYLSSKSSLFPGDSNYNVLLPHYIFNGGGFPLEGKIVEQFDYWGLIPSRGGFMPMWSMGASFFLFPTAALQHLFSGLSDSLVLSAWNQRVASALIAALANLILYSLLNKFKVSQTVIILSLIGFSLSGTQLLISAQTFWQHGVTSLLILLGIHFLLLAEQKEQKNYIYLASFVLSFLPFVRQQSGLFLVAGFIYVIFKNRSAVLGFVAASLPMGLFALAFNYYWFEDFLGGYRTLGHRITLDHDNLSGFIGLFLSANRGLFVFAPFLLLFFLGLKKSNRSFLLTTFFLFSLPYTFIHTLHGRWDAGWSIGPRFMTESTPIFVLLCALGLSKSSRRLLSLYGAGILTAVTISLPGFYYPVEQTRWSAFPDINKIPERAWDFEDWMPLRFMHYVNFSRGKEIPAYVFADNTYLKAIPSDDYAFEVHVPPALKLTEVFKVREVELGKGKYQVVFKGKKETEQDLLIRWKTDVRWQKFWESESIVSGPGEFESRNRFEVEVETKVLSSIYVKSPESFTAISVQIFSLN